MDINGKTSTWFHVPAARCWVCGEKLPLMILKSFDYQLQHIQYSAIVEGSDSEEDFSFCDGPPGSPSAYLSD